MQRATIMKQRLACLRPQFWVTEIRPDRKHATSNSDRLSAPPLPARKRRKVWVRATLSFRQTRRGKAFSSGLLRCENFSAINFCLFVHRNFVISARVLRNNDSEMLRLPAARRERSFLGLSRRAYRQDFSLPILSLASLPDPSSLRECRGRVSKGGCLSGIETGKAKLGLSPLLARGSLWQRRAHYLLLCKVSSVDTKEKCPSVSEKAPFMRLWCVRAFLCFFSPINHILFWKYFVCF